VVPRIGSTSCVAFRLPSALRLTECLPKGAGGKGGIGGKEDRRELPEVYTERF